MCVSTACTVLQTFYKWFFPIFHGCEVALLAGAVLLLRNVWDEFSIKREIIIVFWVRSLPCRAVRAYRVSLRYGPVHKPLSPNLETHKLCQVSYCSYYIYHP